MAAARQKLTAPGASFEVRTEMIRGAPHHTFHHEIRVMADLYRDGLRHCDKPFLVNDDETLTFGEVYERAAGLAARMHEAGIRPGDRVALCMRNYPEWIVTFMACTGAGIICVPLNSWWKGEEILFALQDCGAKMLFADGERLAELAPVSNQLPAGMGLVGVRRGKDAPDGTINWDEFCGDLRGHSFTNASRPDEDILIMYTSGSTGRAKGVVSTHQAVLSTVLSFDLGIAWAWVAELLTSRGWEAARTTLALSVVAIVLAIVVAREIMNAGQANWREGLVLLATYLILAIGFYHLPDGVVARDRMAAEGEVDVPLLVPSSTP